MINLQSFKYLLTEHIEGGQELWISSGLGAGRLEQASVNKKSSVAQRANFPANQI